MTITLTGGGTIRQVVVGTGGTFPLDDIECSGGTRIHCERGLREKMSVNRIQRVVLKYAETGNHGFCVFDTSSDAAEFVRVGRDPDISAGSPIADVVAGSPRQLNPLLQTNPPRRWILSYSGIPHDDGSPLLQRDPQTAAGLHKKRRKRRSRKTRKRVTYKRRRINRKKSKKIKRQKVKRVAKQGENSDKP